MISEEMTINEITEKFPKTLRILHKYKIDSCCGGIHSIKFAAEAHNVELSKLIKELNQVIKNESK